MGLTQSAFSSATGVPLSSLRKYEAGSSEPGASALAQIARLGVSIDWLLTGEGEMIRKPAQSAPVLDQEILCAVIEAIEQKLAGRTLTPRKKAALIALAYDYTAREGACEPAGLERLIRLAL